MKVGFVYQEFFKRHVTGDMHPEQPERLDVIVKALTEAGLLLRMERLSFKSAVKDQLALVHEPAYVDLLQMACENKFSFIGDSDTRICFESSDVAALAAGGVLTACDEVASGRIIRAFCAVRPPGHHAERDFAKGFCLINHVATATEYLAKIHGVKRIAIVDFDAHHGNGTQHIFEDRDDVLYVSIHEHPLTQPFPGSGLESEKGTGKGFGFTLNVYISPGGGWNEYKKALSQKVIPALKSFKPQFMLLSAGFDAHPAESLSNLNLSPEGFGLLTRELVGIANAHCEGKIVSVLEGGYELRSLGRCVVAHVSELMRNLG